MRYSMEIRLRDISKEFPEYEDLYATWCLNKETCSEALKSVLLNYPHFSMHDATHSESIISIIEMLLEERINKLSPTDIWLILNAAYAHDLGMILTFDTVKEEWRKPEFRKFLASLKESEDDDLARAAKMAENIDDFLGDEAWPVELRRSVTIINAAWFRVRHAEISREYLESTDLVRSVDLGHSGMIQPRLLKLLGKICEIHTKASLEVLTLPYKTDGFSSDHAHPRFVAMLLRLGDLLDVDNGRFNATAELVSGPLPSSSRPHKAKHEATTHLLVTPKEIEFACDCPDESSYLETRSFVLWLEEEIAFLTKYWTKISPEDIGGYPPRFDKKELLLRGVPDLKGMAGMRFEISQAKAFQIIEGSNIYEDKFVFIREVIQNAMDASKLQLWRDLISGNYKAWMKDEGVLKKLQPYDLQKEIYQNYAITVNLKALSDEETEIKVTDRGTGITADSFKAMCNVGVSNTASVRFSDEIENMPCWLRPTAGFGVGLQSIFLLTDQFEIDTCTGTESYHATIYSRRKGGYLNLRQVEGSKIRGTTITIRFKMPSNFNYSLGGAFMQYMATEFDPFGGENLSGCARVLESIKRNCGKSMFPVTVNLPNGESDYIGMMDIISIDSQQERNWTTWESKYRVDLSRDCGKIIIWDTEKATYGEISIVRQGYSGNNVLFKGVGIGKNTPYFPMDGISCSIDIYGEDTRKMITLNRAALTPEGRDIVKEVLDNMLKIYKKNVLRKLQYAGTNDLNQICTSQQFNAYTFWRLCNLEERTDIPEKVIESITSSARALVKGNEGQYEVRFIQLNKIILPPDISKYTFINFQHFNNHGFGDASTQDELLTIFNGIEEKHEDIIIVDEKLTEAVGCYCITEVKRGDCEKALYIMKLDGQVNPAATLLPSLDKKARAAFLKGLASPISGLIDGGLHSSAKSKRYAIPAFDEYGDLAVRRCPFGVEFSSLNNTPYIIAPFDREQAKMTAQLSKEAFTRRVMNSPQFEKVVEYVRKNASSCSETEIEQIRESYKRLIEEYYDLKVKEL